MSIAEAEAMVKHLVNETERVNKEFKEFINSSNFKHYKENPQTLSSEGKEKAKQQFANFVEILRDKIKGLDVVAIGTPNDTFDSKLIAHARALRKECQEIIDELEALRRRL